MPVPLPDRVMGRSWISPLIAALVIALAVFHAIGEARVTPLAFDEAYNLNLIKTLAQEGVYASKLVGADYRYFDPNISTGPALILPYAASLRMLGASLDAARGTAIMQLAVSLLLVYVSGLVIVGRRAAPLFLALFAYAPLVIEIGVWVQGDIPSIALGLACLVSFTLGQRKQRTSSRMGFFLVSGLALGIAVLMKDILLLLGVALILSAGYEFLRHPKRLSTALEMLIPVVVGLAIYISWQIFPFLYLRAFLPPEHLQIYALQAAERAGLIRRAVVLDPFSHTIPAFVNALGVFRPIFVGALIFLLYLLFSRARRVSLADAAEPPLPPRLLGAAVLVWFTWYFLLSGSLANVRHLLPGVIWLELLLVWLAKYYLESIAGETVQGKRLSIPGYLAVSMLLILTVWAMIPGWRALVQVPTWKAANRAAQDEAVAWLSENAHDDAPLYGWGWFVPWNLGYIADREVGRVLPGEAGAGIPGWFVLTPELGNTGNLDDAVLAFIDSLGAPAFENTHYRIYAYEP